MADRPQHFAAWMAAFGAAALFGGAPEPSTDLATEQLGAIVERELRLYEKLREDPEHFGPAEIERRVGDILMAYKSFLEDNPDDLEALILYGKLLRRANETEAAFTAFLKADGLDPGIAVVKQQIGNHLAEQDRPLEALPFFLKAVDLEPGAAVYHFGLGQLLAEFRARFTAEGVFTSEAVDREMIKAFRQAARLEPDNFDFQMRLGEAYYDLSVPDWKNALLHWNRLRRETDEALRTEIIDLHRARVLGELGRVEEAREIAEAVEEPALQFSRQQVLDVLSMH
jgi:tetratricopeptide (TPR) repeat protein